MFGIQSYVAYDIHSSSLKKMKSKSVSIKIVRELQGFFFIVEVSFCKSVISNVVFMFRLPCAIMLVKI